MSLICETLPRETAERTFNWGILIVAGRENQLSLDSCFSRDAKIACESVRSSSDLKEARTKYGTPKVGAGTSDGLIRLLRNYVKSKPQIRSVWDFIPDPPQHIWTKSISSMKQPVWDWQEPPDRVRVRRQTALHQEISSTILEDHLILDVDLS